LIYKYIYLLVIAIVLFVVIIGVVNGWLRYRSWRDDKFVVGKIYSFNRMLWLYLKCWGIVMAGLCLALLFDWLMMYLPDTLYDLTMEFRIVFYVLCGLLTVFSLVSVVNGEALVELRLRNAQTQNQLLKSQLNPHFLYNTLNNIDALIWLDQERASTAVNNLSRLMRYFTYSGKQERVKIGEEVEYLRQLVDLQRLRMPVADALIFEVELDDENIMVAPLLLLPLVENCFKHCGDLNEPHAIEIQLQLKKGKLHFRSSNNLKALEGKIKLPHGLGLDVLHRRLDLLYNKRFELALAEHDNRYVTDLVVKL